MKVVIENNKERDYILRVGDCVVLQGSGIYVCVIIKDNDSKYRYKAKCINVKTHRDICANTLEELTKLCNRFDYKIYNQDEYELVIRKK